MLSKDDYYDVCSKTNLVSIDLIVEHDNKFLVGKRINKPAKGYYFVPGGVIYKSEKIKDTIERLSQVELGIKLTLDDFKFHVISQHWYADNFRDDKFGSHYVSLSYTTKISDEQYAMINLDDQHCDVKWLSIDELLNDKSVHPNTKGFFDQSYFDIIINDYPVHL